MKQEHHVKDLKNNGKGAVYDTDKEISGIENDGTYLDSKNGRVSSDRGNKRSWEKIRGEEMVYQNDVLFYSCIGSIGVNDHLVEFWASNISPETNIPRIVVDGVIRGSSDKMPWTQENPFQMDKNESCIGGEVYITDNKNVPMIFNVEDLIDPEDGPETYFEDYNPALYSVNLDAPVDIPVFKELQFIGGGGGLPVGSYQYSLRYVNSEGDRTNWGPLTNHIPVLQKYSEGGTIYPYQSSYGDVSNLELPSPYGVKLKFRVTNIADYDFVEVRRISYNNSEGIGVVPEGEIVARIDIGDQEVSVRTFVDPLNSNVNETLTEEDESYQNTVIKRAKSIRYHDKRLVLMNVETETQTPDATFTEIEGEKIFPVVEKLGKAGHKDPYNHHNYKNYMSGEKNSFGVSFYDSSGGKSFVLNNPDLIDVQAPNRRDVMDSKSLKYSYGGASVAANVSGSVGNTFEVFDLEDAVSKTDLCSFKNITNNKSNNLLRKQDPTVQNKTKGAVTRYCEEDPGYKSVVQAHEIGYRPYTPTGKNSNESGHNYIINPQVDADGNGVVDYRPEAFGPNYYSKGYALSGVSNIPDWAKSFSVVQTEEAERVVCQGLGMYSVGEADITGATLAKGVDKATERMWFYSPDIEAGFVNSGILTDLNDNPQNYEVQFISPLGFFSEVFDFEEITSLNDRDRCIDMITYARILHDEGQINPTEDGSMGLGGSGNRYVAYNRYRNTSDSSTQGFFSGDGNKTNTLTGFETITEGRNVYYDLELSQSVYQHPTTGGNYEFTDQGMKDWTEPFYIVNIIQKGRSLVDNDTDFYRNTGAYQKVDSIVGQSDGSPDQEFELVDERWEDCIPALSSSHQMSGDNVFIYVQQKDLSKRAWLNVTYKSTADTSSIESAISADGYYIDPSTGTFVYGTYTHSISSNKRDFTLKLNQGYIPEEDLKIIVSYDNRRPIRIFGGNTTVGDTVFAPIDRVSDGSKNTDEDDATFDSTAEVEFEWGNAGFPFREYHQNPRHYSVIRTTGANRIQGTFGNDGYQCRLSWIRQMAVLFTCESRVATHYAHISEYPLQYFPAVNYVQRPRRWDTDDFGSQDGEIISKENNLWYQYFRDFPGEWNNWQYGGFRINQQSNIDYSKQGPLEFASAPDFGFEEKNEFCTGIFWSLPRPINAQDSPGLKTFTDLNRFEIDDDQGEIKYAYDAKMGEKGSNLYSITETGVCLLLTNKSVLSNPNSTELTVTAQDSFIGDEYWVSKDIGSNDQMWRGIAEDSVEIPTETGRMLVDALYMPNDYSVFRLMGNEIKDIAKDTYFTRINPILQEIKPGFETKVTGGFDRNHNEYWLSIERPSGDKEVFVYAQDTSHFVGFFTYDFDQYTFIGSEMYGSRESETYLLDKGYQINGENIESYLIQKTSPNQPLEKEFIDFEVLTGPRGTMKPTRVEFLDEDQNFLSALDETIQGPLYLKQYDGWRQFVPRKDESVDPKQSRIQYRLLLYKIFHNLAEDFKIVDSIIQYKEIK